MQSSEIYEILKNEFGESILEFKKDAVVEPYIVVVPDRIRDIAYFLRDDERLQFTSLMCLSSVDYNDGTLGVVYHLHSMTLGHKIVLKVRVPKEAPHVQSVEAVWKAANWHEREAYDLMGIAFDGHPDLRRILLPYDWEGHPLRKDYKVPEFYNGMKVPY
ncbi:MAG: NADH-quinone oxidoreductase subunit C [Bacteroidota bacterium]